MSVNLNRAKWLRILKDPLTVALALSLLLHLAGAATWKIGDRLGWWKRAHVPHWIEALQRLGSADPEKIRAAMVKQARHDTQLTFIEVDPSKPSEAPEKAEHYGAASTRAANPDPKKTSSNKPKIDGREQPFDKVLANLPPTKAADEPSKAFPLRPDPKIVTEPDRPSDKETKAGDRKSVENGETLMAKSDPRPKNGATFGDPDQGLATTTQQRPRPRSVAEALARLGGTPGERTRTLGGTMNDDALAFDVKGTPFGQYDARFIDVVRTTWYQAMGNQFAGRSGDVQIRFNLHADGTISDLIVADTSVDDLQTYYCRHAIEKPRFDPWPVEMRREIGSNSREITFTFHYL